jgi:predicted FMN-binding regulatory protein PaiB
MNADFIAIVQTLITEQSKDALVNPAWCKAKRKKHITGM